jgi:predicted transposase YdaD
MRTLYAWCHLPINLMQLTIASEKAIAQQAKELIQRVQLESTDALPKNEIIDIIYTSYSNLKNDCDR